MNRPLLQTITVYFFAGRPGGRPLQGLCVLLYGPASSTVLTLGQSTLLAGGVLVGLAAARSRSRSDSPPDCHSLRSRRFATSPPTMDFIIFRRGDSRIVRYYKR